MTDDPLAAVSDVGARYRRAKERLDKLTVERRDAVRAALDAKAGTVSDISRRAGMTREQVARIGAGVTSGRNTDWRAEKRHAATPSDDSSSS